MQFRFILRLVSFTLLAGCAPKLTERAASCEASTQAAVTAHGEQQMAFYQRHDGSLPPASHRATYYPGTNGKVVALVHGFISSPESMVDLAHVLNAQGYAVLAPLLTGYGGGPSAANASTKEDWKASVQTALADASLCHKDVSLVAHSLGGAMGTLALQDSESPNVSHVAMLAPFYKTHGAWLNNLNDLVSLGTDTVYLDDVEKYLGIDPYETFGVQRPGPGEPPVYLPLTALREVLSMQDSFGEAPRSQLPQNALEVISEADQIVDASYAISYFPAVFRNAKVISYPASEHIGHNLESREKNPHFSELSAQILALLGGR
jgi:predicted alpha/beta hydrolase family esterase